MIQFDYDHFVFNRVETLKPPTTNHNHQQKARCTYFFNWVETLKPPTTNHQARCITGEVHISLCGEQASLWNLQESAHHLGWEECRLLGGQQWMDEL